jgi:hypothetical protein
MNNSIDYGDNVKVAPDAPQKYEPDIMASACGFRIIQSEEEAQLEGVAIGTKLWLIERGDGSSLEVPEKFLIRL